MKHDDPLRDDDPVLDRAIRRAFMSSSEVTARGDDEARIEAAIARTLEARGTRPPSRSMPRMTVYLVAAALCAGALAYAAVHQRTDTAADDSLGSAAPAATADENEAGGTAASLEPAPPVTPDSPPVTPDSLPSVASVAPGRPPNAPPAAVTPTKRSEPSSDALGPAELFARANDARRTNDTKRAVALYEELQSRFPQSREASTSRVALGRLLLDRAGDPARARALFAGYLDRDPSGPLAEEARAGRALAAMRLGDRDSERAAWLELLERHPGSVHAERARQRLSEPGN